MSDLAACHFGCVISMRDILRRALHYRQLEERVSKVLER